jgi:voltage-gated potassium channel
VSEVDVRHTEGKPGGHMVRTAMLAVGCAALALALYYIVPILRKPHGPVWWRLLVALVIFGVVLSHELGSIVRHAEPMQRAVIAISVLIPLFVVMFSWIYLTMSRSNPGSFSTPMSRSTALYFTITVFSTVGFGDIVPHTDPARLVTSVQMVSDLVLLAVVVRLLFGVASREAARRRLPLS